MNEVSQPEFPLWWLEKSKRNMEALSVIASHLHDKTAAGRNARSGFMGTANDMEKQIIGGLTSPNFIAYMERFLPNHVQAHV